MERDKKVGLSLGIMLVGIVGAFFFRNDADLQSAAPDLKDPGTIDELIAERDNAPYIVQEKPSTTKTKKSVHVPLSDPWDLPDFLKDDEASSSVAYATTPDPIPVVKAQPPAEVERPVVEPPVETREVATAPPQRTAEYTVRRGDTLSEIAESVLGSSSKYPALYELNRDRLSSPNALRPGMKIRIPVAQPARVVETRPTVAPPFSSQSPRSAKRQPVVTQRKASPPSRVADKSKRRGLQ